MKKSELKALIREVVKEAYFGAAGMAHASNRDAEKRRRDAEKDAAKKKSVQHPTPEELAAAKKKLADMPDEDWGNYRGKVSEESELKALIREVIEEMGARTSSQKNNPSNYLKKLGNNIRMTYPHLNPQLDSVDDGAILEIYTGETRFYIYIAGYKNGEPIYGVESEWPEDAKGKKRLSADEMVKAIATIPGVSD